MPISLRLPAEVDSQIASYSARLGLSKSAMIVRSIEEFLAKNAQPSAYQLYLDAMESVQSTPTQSVKAKPPFELRPLLQICFWGLPHNRGRSEESVATHRCPS